MNQAEATALLADPNLDPTWLADIAYRFPGLRPRVSQHPRAYPELVQWIQMQPAATSPRVVAAAEDKPTALAAVTSAQTVPAGNPPIDAGKNARSKTPLAVGIVIAVVVAVLGGFAAWWFTGGRLGAPQADPLARPPVDMRAVDLAVLGEDFQVLPLDHQGRASLRVGAVTIVMVAHQDRNYLLGIDDAEGLSAPLWVSPVAPDSNCEVAGNSLQCGGEELDAATGFPTIIPGGQSEGEEPAEEEDLDLETPGEQSGESAAAEEEQQSSETAELAEVVVGGTVLQGQPQEGIPLAVVGSDLVMDENVIVSDLAPGTWWALPATEKTWLISDGFTVRAVSGQKELWTYELPDGSAQASGFVDGNPTWAATPTTVLVGEPDGIVALDIASGEPRWRVDTPVQSFRADQQGLVVSTGQAVVTFSFPDPIESEPIEDQQSVDLDVLPLLAEEQAHTQMPTLEHFANANLEIPAYCLVPGDDLMERGPVSVTFTDGQAEGPTGQITQLSAQYSILNGQPMIVSSLQCPVGFHWSVPYGLVYDAELNLISITALDQHNKADLGEAPRWSAQVDGNLLTARSDSGWFTSVVSIATFAWNGEDFELVDVAYETASGLQREPSAAAVQALDVTSGTVLGCAGVPMPGVDLMMGTSYNPRFEGGHIESPDNFEGDWPDVGQLEGDWICAVDGPYNGVGRWGDGETAYNEWLVVRADENGVPTLIGHWTP